jgi:hypothetical protein
METSQKFSALDKALLSEKWDEFDRSVGLLTIEELRQYLYEVDHPKKIDPLHYMWIYHVTWAFDAHWAMILAATPNERVVMCVSLDDVPENFDINRTLADG